jgi:hypothetical protein
VVFDFPPVKTPKEICVGGTHPSRVPLGEGALPEGHPPLSKRLPGLGPYPTLGEPMGVIVDAKRPYGADANSVCRRLEAEVAMAA